MIDIEAVKKHYSTMLDSELIYLADKDNNGLTEAALIALFDEFRRRGLNTSVFFTIMENRSAIKDHITRLYLDYENKEILKIIWNTAIDLKKDHQSDLEIWQHLTAEHGLGEEKATLIVWSLENKVKEFVRNAHTELVAGVCLLLIGIANITIGTGFSFFALVPFISGLPLFLTGVSKYDEYKKVLQIIIQEKHVNEDHVNSTD